MTMADERAAFGSPEVMKRKLRSALRQAREDAAMTQKAIADKLFWSQSKIIRIEQGNVPVAPSDVRVLLLEYGVTDEERITALMELARESRRPDEWAAYKAVYSAEALTLFSNERAARLVQKYEPSVVPGLFQTEAYARGLFEAVGLDPETLEQRLELRLRRQELLDSPDCPDLDFIIGEAALLRPAGGKRAMRVQLERLKQLARNPKITLQVLPFAAGPHRGMGSAFTILQFSDPDLPDLLYLEDSDKESLTRDDKDELARFGERFGRLKELSENGSVDAQIDEVVARLYS